MWKIAGTPAWPLPDLVAHIKRVHGIVSGYLTLLQCIKDCLPCQTRLTFYNCYILPHLDYCITIWGNASSVIRLYSLQKRAARIITDSEYLASSAPLMRPLRWLPPTQRVQYHQAQLVYSAVNGLAPDYICCIFRPVSEVSSRATRASVRGDLCVPPGRTCTSRNMVARAGAIIWNNLSPQVTRCQTLLAFKRAFIDYIMNWLSAILIFTTTSCWYLSDFSAYYCYYCLLAVIFSHQLF